MDNDIFKVHEQALNWISEVVAFVKVSLTSELQVTQKTSAYDIVTNVDRQVEKMFHARIKQTFPDHAIIGEETDFGETLTSENSVWIIDPIDGTVNFAKQRDYFSTILSFYQKGEGKLGYIYDFTKDLLYYAIQDVGVFELDLQTGEKKRLQAPEHLALADNLVTTDVQNWHERKSFVRLVENCLGIRYFGCGGLDALSVFTGKTAAFINTYAEIWDIAAQLIFARELGIVVSYLNGDEMDLPSGGGHIIANPGSFMQIIEILQDEFASGKEE